MNILHIPFGLITLLLIINPTFASYGYGSSCNTENDCDSKLHFVCGDAGFCKCDSTRVYNSASSQCALRPGSNCTRQETCTENSECVNSETVSKCECKHGYIQDGATCRQTGSLGDMCSTNGDCATTFGMSRQPTNLVCVNGQCLCDEEISTESPFHSYLEPPCFKFVGQPCINEFYYDQCVTGATCTTINFNATCECMGDSGYVKNGKICETKRGYGKACWDSDACDDLQYLRCNLTKGVCTCLPNMIYSLERCSLVPGSKCGDGVPCSQNAKCHPATKICTCHSGTIPFDNRCLVDEGGFCLIDDNFTCHCGAGLYCRNNKCSCPYSDHQVYDRKSRSCLSLVGGPCDDNVKCVKNAECVTTNGLISCQCKSGFTGVDRVCDELAFDAPCRNKNNFLKCDTLAGLNCGITGKCDCSDFQIYDKEEEKCRGLVGSKCGVRDEDFCVNEAVCKKFRGRDVQIGVCMCGEGLYLQSNRTCGNASPENLVLERLIV